MSAERWFREHSPNQRWFADKARAINHASIIWTLKPAIDSPFDLNLAQIEFADGSQKYYLAALDPTHERDVTVEPAFTSWLLRTLLDSRAPSAELSWDRLVAVPPEVATAPGRSLGVQQSNTSIRYPGDVLIKVNRRLSSGISPEVELSSVMQRTDDRTATTATYGSLWLEHPAHGRLCLAIASQFVPNEGDGWSTMLNRLRSVRDRSGFASSMSEVTAIAELTSSMHRALAGDPWREPVAPELISAEDTASWIDSSSRELDQLLLDFRRQRNEHAEDIRQLTDFAHRSAPEMHARLQQFDVLRGTHKLRIHGDYHLGQVLRKPDGGYVAIDFDGEPARPLSERRRKYSALRDVAGMLRSFAYVRGTVELERTSGGEEISILREWELAARELFIDVYVRGVRDQPFTFLPASGEDIRQALGALELEKAVYECRYEINNRPDWLWLPLSRLVQGV